MKFKSTKDVSSERFYGLIVGESGIGKTSLVKTLPTPMERVLIISAESGLLCLSGTDIQVFEIGNNTWEDICEIVLFLQEDNGKRFDYVYIDSLTEIVEKMLEQLKRDPKLSDAKNTFLLWGKLKENMKIFLKTMRDLKKCSVVFTCLPATEKDGLELVDIFKMPGGIKDDVKPLFDIVMHYQIFKDEDGAPIRKLVTSDEVSKLAKDRSGLLDHYEDPDLSVIIKKVLGK